MSTSNSLIGAAVERLEDLRFLRGTGVYVGDLPAPSGALHAVILRSSVAHGMIRRIDASAALKLPGVHAVVTAADLGDVMPKIALRLDPLPEFKAFEQTVLAHRKVRFAGEPIALVVADTQAIAEDALDAIDVEIDELPAVVDTADITAGRTLVFEEHGSNLAATITGSKGDADAAFATAPYTRKETCRVHRHSAVPMEPRGLLAEWDAARRLMKVSGAVKVPFHNRSALALLLDLPVENVLMIENDVGGGFGVRGEFYPEDFLVPFAARLTGRPVKWSEDRRENLLATNHAREADCEIEIACDRQGRILALRAKSLVHCGAYLRTTGSTPARNIAQVLPGPYRIEHIRSDVTLVVSNKTPSGTYRGPGRFESDFFRERMLDLAAADLGLDRVAFRRMNLVRLEDMPWPMPAVGKLSSECDSGDYSETLERCLAEFGWPERAALAGKLVDGRYHGCAVGCYVEGAGSGRESVRLALDPDGRLRVHTGSSGIGQGLETVFAQMAGDAMGLPLDQIAGVFHGSTDLVTDGVGSFSSRSVVMGGSALLVAAEKLKAALRAAAASRWGCAVGDVEIDGGCLGGPGGRVLGLADLADAVAPVDGSFSTPKRTYSYGAHAAHVAVDAATGHVRVLAYVAVEDVGRIINPETLHGQCLGAIVQGLGGTLLEHFVHDENGQMIAGSFADYLLPTASDFPDIKVFALANHPSPVNPLGAKGAGEGGIIPVGGLIANAVASALADFDARPNQLPLSPARVWAMTHDPRTGAMRSRGPVITDR